MAGGWTRDGAVQEQIEASIDDELRRMRSRRVFMTRLGHSLWRGKCAAMRTNPTSLETQPRCTNAEIETG